MEVEATKHYTDYSFVLVLQELHITPGNLSCTPRGTCIPFWEPLVYMILNGKMVKGFNLFQICFFLYIIVEQWGTTQSLSIVVEDLLGF